MPLHFKGLKILRTGTALLYFINWTTRHQSIGGILTNKMHAIYNIHCVPKTSSTFLLFK